MAQNGLPGFLLEFSILEFVKSLKTHKDGLDYSVEFLADDDIDLLVVKLIELDNRGLRRLHLM